MSSRRMPCLLHSKQGLNIEYLKGQGVRIYAPNLTPDDDDKGCLTAKNSVLLLCDTCIKFKELAFVEAERIVLPKQRSEYKLPLHNSAGEWVLLGLGEQRTERPGVGFLMTDGSISDHLRLKVVGNPTQLARLIAAQAHLQEASTHKDIPSSNDKREKRALGQKSSLFVSPGPSQAPGPGLRAVGVMPTSPNTHMHSADVMNEFYEEPSTSDGTEVEIAKMKARLASLRKERQQLERARLLEELEKEEAALRQEKDKDTRKGDVKPEIIDLTMKSE